MVLEVGALFGSVGGSLWVLDVGEGGDRQRDRGSRYRLHGGVRAKAVIAVWEACGLEADVDVAVARGEIPELLVAK